MRYLLLLAAMVGLWGACGASAETLRARISTNPYAGVNWGTVNQYKASFHEHTYTYQGDATRIQTTLDAGYDIAPNLHYSGGGSASFWNQAHYPQSDWLPLQFLVDAAAAQQLVLLGAEQRQTGVQHFTSWFFNDYIENFATVQEGVSLVTAAGGLAFLAHPADVYDGVPIYGATGIEIYNAIYKYWAEDTGPTNPSDYNDTYFVPYWDAALAAGWRLWGFAVNDWAGPWVPIAGDYTEEIVDSGKMIILADYINETTVKAAMVSGEMFAVKDIGDPDDAYPDVTEVVVDGWVVTVTSDAPVTWISMGSTVGTGPSFDTRWLASTDVYLRAQSENGDGSITYLQPFFLTPYDASAWRTDATGVTECPQVGAGEECLYAFTDETDSNWLTIGNRASVCLDGDVAGVENGAAVQIRRAISAESANGSYVISGMTLTGVYPGECLYEIQRGRIMVDVVSAPRNASAVVMVEGQ
jgi:hypothetical protein